MRKQVLTTAAIAVCALAVCAGMAGARGTTFKNSGFERNSFQFWNTKQENDSGDWVVYKGSPTFEELVGAPGRGILPDNEIPKPRRGKYAAVTIQGGPSTQLLFRDITLKPGAKRKLAFVLSYQNYAGVFANPTPDNLHASSPAPPRPFGQTQRGGLPPEDANQQFRIDIVRKGANPYSIDDADVVKNLIRSRTGDPNEAGWKRQRFNLSSLDPGKYKLRVAVVASLFPLVVEFDALKLAQAKAG